MNVFLKAFFILIVVGFVILSLIALQWFNISKKHKEYNDVYSRIHIGDSESKVVSMFKGKYSIMSLNSIEKESLIPFNTSGFFALEYTIKLWPNTTRWRFVFDEKKSVRQKSMAD